MYPSSSKELNKETDNEVYFFIPSFYPFDSFWGIGSERNGKNMLGKIWMKIRNEIYAI